MTDADNEPEVRTLKVGPFQTFCYVAACPRTLQGVVIDPGAEVERIAAAVHLMKVRVRFILLTHGHPDHVWGAGRLSCMTGAPCAMHEEDDDFFRSVAGPDPNLQPRPADVRLKDGQALRAGGLSFRVLHTPGHTPGSVCYLCGGRLFTGDTLFVGAVGKTEQGGGLETLLESIEKKILPLPGDTIIHPGHDYGETPASTLNHERRTNPYITDFILSQ